MDLSLWWAGESTILIPGLINHCWHCQGPYQHIHHIFMRTQHSINCSIIPQTSTTQHQQHWFPQLRDGSSKLSELGWSEHQWSFGQVSCVNYFERWIKRLGRGLWTIDHLEEDFWLLAIEKRTIGWNYWFLCSRGYSLKGAFKPCQSWNVLIEKCRIRKVKFQEKSIHTLPKVKCLPTWKCHKMDLRLMAFCE